MTQVRTEGPWRSDELYARMNWCILKGGTNSLTLTAQRLYATPYQATFRQTLDRIGWCNLDVAQGNVKLAIYEDNGDTPVGGALIVGSASIAVAGIQRKQEATIADTQLDPGLYWLILLALAGLQPNIMRPNSPVRAFGTLFGVVANIASDNLPDPAPAMSQEEIPTLYVRVKSVP